MSSFVGRRDALRALHDAYATALDPPGGGSDYRAGLVLVGGEAGMGKTALLGRFAAEAAARGARTVWGTCWPAEQAPAYWPWTQVLRSLHRKGGNLSLAPQLVVIVAPGDPAPSQLPDGDDRGVRLRLFDEVRQLLAADADGQPLVVILDDLQWTDQSSLDLLRFLTGITHTAPLLIVGAYRNDELDATVGAAMAGLLTGAEAVVLTGLSQAEVGQLVSGLAGEQVATRWAQAVYQRSGGHPFFIRELSHALGSGDAVAGVPAAVREAIARRLARVSTACAGLLGVAAVADPHLEPAVLADLTGYDATRIAELVREAFTAGVLTAELSTADARTVRFSHDLYRESIYDSLAAGQRLDLHHRVAAALVSHHERGATVFPSELARHFSAAVPVAGPDHALAWARTAARAEESRFAFAEAAGHLARARIAVTAVGAKLSDADLVDLLTTEAAASGTFPLSLILGWLACWR